MTFTVTARDPADAGPAAALEASLNALAPDLEETAAALEALTFRCGEQSEVVRSARQQLIARFAALLPD